MSLQAEPATSSRGGVGDEEVLDEQQRREALWQPQDAVSATTRKAYRHLHIDWPNASIKKTLSIGASAPEAAPPIYDWPKPQDEAENASSCVLVTKSSPINATIHIARENKSQAMSSSTTSNGVSADSNNGETSKKPILVSAKTGSVGAISLSVPEYHGARPLSIRAKSNNGNITIFLPTSFSGLLNWGSETGTLKVSPAMRQRFKLLDPEPHKHRGTAKIAPSTASGQRGDVCHISNRHGSITIKEFGEDASGSAGSKSCTIQ